MVKFVTAVSILTFSLGAAAFAGTPSNPAASTASPADPAAQQSTHVLYANSISMFGGAANPNVPGATGRSIVPGDNSTIAGDANATEEQRTGTLGPQ